MTAAKREAILFPFGCSEVNSTWLITSELANQRARKALNSLVWYILKSSVVSWENPNTQDIIPEKVKVNLPYSKKSKIGNEIDFDLLGASERSWTGVKGYKSYKA